MSYDLVGYLMADMNPELLDFLRTKVTSLTKWDLIHFFHEHPNTSDTAEHIARRARRDADIIRAELSELVNQRVLVNNRQDESATYALSPDPEVRDLIRRFVEASADRQFRVKAIYHVVRSMR